MGERALRSALLVAAGLCVAFAVPNRVMAVDMRGTVWIVDGTDSLRLETRELVNGKWRRRVTRERDRFAITLTFGSDGTDQGGSFTITDYEPFPVTGTWTSTNDKTVRLSIDQSALNADLTDLLCPGGSCTVTSSWPAFTVRVKTKSNTMKLKFREDVTQTFDDTSAINEKFVFNGTGPQATVPPAKGRAHRHRRL